MCGPKGVETAQAAVTDYSVCSAQGPKGAHLLPPRPHYLGHTTSHTSAHHRPDAQNPFIRISRWTPREDTDCNVYDNTHVGKGVENEKVSFLTAI